MIVFNFSFNNEMTLLILAILLMRPIAVGVMLGIFGNNLL